jgi:hypothetical protein
MGFGLGIIAGASMLQLIIFAKEQEQSLMVADSPKTYTQQQLDEAVAKAREEAANTAPASGGEADSAPAPQDGLALKPGPGASDSASTGPASEDVPPSASPEDQPSATSDTEATLSFYINPGMDLKTVARSLKRLGLIDDADDFVDEARPYSKSIQPGTCVFKGKPTYQEIIAELIRKKVD